MDENERIVATERVPVEMLLILVELADVGVPIDVAERALEMAKKPARLAEALELCLDAMPDLDETLTASVRAVVLLCEAATTASRDLVAVPRESALARDPFPLLEEARDPRDLPTASEWLRASAPMREVEEADGD